LTQSAIGKTAQEQGEDSTKRTQLWLALILAAGWGIQRRRAAY